jgi:hypothetical protein
MPKRENVDMRVAATLDCAEVWRIKLTGRINGDSDNWHLDQKEK